MHKKVEVGNINKALIFDVATKKMFFNGAHLQTNLQIQYQLLNNTVVAIILFGMSYKTHNDNNPQSSTSKNAKAMNV